MDKTGHLCRLDFERFGERIGIVKPRLRKILDKYMQLPDNTVRLVDHSFLNNKMKRAYLRIVKERITVLSESPNNIYFIVGLVYLIFLEMNLHSLHTKHSGSFTDISCDLNAIFCLSRSLHTFTVCI
jgi:hypothetical protein